MEVVDGMVSALQGSMQQKSGWENFMPPLSRPRRRRLMLLNESPNGNIVAEPAEPEAPTVIVQTAGTMQQQFLEDCGVPEGIDVQVTVQGRPEVHAVHLLEAFAFIGR